MKKSHIIGAALTILVIFLALRLPGLDMPYYQDEWKNVSSSQSREAAGGFFTHPPLQQILFSSAYQLVGPDLMRLVPMLFYLASGILLFLVVFGRFGRPAAWWAAALYTMCAYGIHGSLSPDVDGAIMPFFFLLALYAYDKFMARPALRSARIWFSVFVLALLAGLLTKLSFIIVIGVFVLDYLWQIRQRLSVRSFFSVLGLGLAFLSVYTASLYLIEWLYPHFSISAMFSHAQDSGGGLGRNWIQIAVQSLKAVFFLSPALILPLFFATAEVRKKASPFLIYLGLGAVFYLVIFDFSRAHLDKYLLFIVVPLAAISGMALAKIFRDDQNGSGGRPYILSIIAALGASAVLFALNFLPHRSLPLYPKTEWFYHVARLQWDFLNPFTGGNGPMGFYVSFLFIAASFTVSASLAILALAKVEWRGRLMAVILAIGLSYNLVLATEMFHGRLNGSAAQVLVEAVGYIENDPDISEVLTYNDAGAGNLSRIGKYAGRFYAAPDFEEGHRQKFAEFNGHYLVVEIPLLYDGFYRDFFSACETVFEARSGEISGRVYSCATPGR